MKSSLTAIVSLSLIFLSCGDDSRCRSINACVEFGKNKTMLITPLYWYDVSVEKCVLLRPDCTNPNVNVTFTSVSVCEDTCAVTVEPDESKPVAVDCQTKQGNCNEDLAPMSQSSHPVSLVVSISCTIGVVALVVVIVVATYAMRRRKQALRKKYLENMLNQFSEPNQYDSSDDSFDDNPEENNLFDRLEQQW